jgi:4-hydroxybenzoate polyprenyltransferase
MVAVLLSPVPYLSLGFSVWYLVVVMFADLCFLNAILRLRGGDAAGSSRLFKQAMMVALAAFVVGSLGGGFLWGGL